MPLLLLEKRKPGRATGPGVREAESRECALPSYTPKVSMGILKGSLRITAHSPLKEQESISITLVRFSGSHFSKELPLSAPLIEHITQIIGGIQDGVCNA